MGQLAAFWEERKLNPISSKNKLQIKELNIKKYNYRDFPGNPVVKTLHFHYRGNEFDPWSRNVFVTQ